MDGWISNKTKAPNITSRNILELWLLRNYFHERRPFKRHVRHILSADGCRPDALLLSSLGRERSHHASLQQPRFISYGRDCAVKFIVRNRAYAAASADFGGSGGHQSVRLSLDAYTHLLLSGHTRVSDVPNQPGGGGSRRRPCRE